MPLRDRGEGFLKLILALLVFAALIFTGVKVVPVYFNSSQLADYIKDRAVQATTENVEPDVIQAEVVHYARELGLPVSADNVSITSDPGMISIKLDYTVPVDLEVVTWNLHFTPSAVSRAY